MKKPTCDESQIRFDWGRQEDKKERNSLVPRLRDDVFGQ